MKIINFYYFDEENDDFANTGIKTRLTPDNFNYNQLIEFFILGGYIKNRKVLKPMKKKKDILYV